MNEQVSDMYLAATLLAYGADLDDIDRDNPRRQLFTFSGEIQEIWVKAGNAVLRIEKPTFDDINTKWAGNSLMFPPNFVDCVRKIKSVIHGA